jgi:hypothetical protein
LLAAGKNQWSKNIPTSQVSDLLTSLQGLIPPQPRRSGFPLSRFLDLPLADILLLFSPSPSSLPLPRDVTSTANQQGVQLSQHQNGEARRDGVRSLNLPVKRQASGFHRHRQSIS